ncbi:hypothetical protein AFK24_21775 [Pseudomonas syringae]|uniref:Secreted protein n=1 Tax=Pseudomonas syringae TaxID=317 RepID=A0A1C7Z3W0_PSESX|nr:hypothetical protein [Pseudomonas syringae]OCR22865.1 hypothetical protein AFK24_21775 [Pseudomonas syringae]
MIRLNALRLLALVGLIGVGNTAYAHGLVCSCEELPDQQVRCVGGFSSGDGVPNVTVDVIDYNERILIPGKFGPDSTFTFKRPKGEFYVLMDVGAGHVLEVDHLQIKPAL